jgi:hypothetical protein
MTLFFGEGTNRPVHKPTDLIQYLPEDRKHHYRDGFSMAETAKAWVGANGRLPPSIARIVGSDRLNSAHFEYPTAVWGGGISMSDVMAFVPGSAIAVEGKAREPFGEEVRIWIHEQKNRNQLSPEHRQEVISRYARAFGLENEQPLLSLRYQLFHRTLSAALTARATGAGRAWMIVQAFAPLDSPEHLQNRGDFDRYIEVVGGMPVLEGVKVGIAWAQEAS